MNRLKALRNRQAAIRARMDQILASQNENGELTDDLSKEFGELEKEAASVQAGIDREARLLEIEKSLNPIPDANEAATKKAVEQANKAAETKVEKFATLGEQLMAVMAASRVGGFVDPRLYRGAVSGANESTGSEGGFLVQSEFVNDLMGPVYNTGVILSRCPKPIEIGEGKNKLTVNMIDETNRTNGYRWGGVLGYWVGEGETATATKPKVRKSETQLEKVMAILYATEELLEDATAISGVVNEAFTKEMVFQLENAIINGTGAGQPLGILNAACLVSQAKETGQTAATIVTENIAKMWARLPASSQNSGSLVWLCNQDVFPQLMQMSLPVGTGGIPTYMPPGGLSASPYSTIFGKPVLPVEYCATLGTVGDLILADLSEYRLIAKGGIRQSSSVHVRFLYDEQTFKFTYRVGGQPKLAAAKTPFKGSNTQSPFVALATRS